MENFQATKSQVYDQLNQINQSSAAVECINSLLRPYLNTCKNRVNQEFLNLFMFYHNHHCLGSGIRKGKSPFELATGLKNEGDWIDLLLKKIQLN